MTITSDAPLPVPRPSAPSVGASEPGEGAERIPDNEAEAVPSKAPLRAHEGTQVDLTA